MSYSHCSNEHRALGGVVDVINENEDYELLKRLVICHADLQMALSAITFLGDIDPEEKYSKIDLRRFKCYETTFVVSYGRAFTKSAGGRFGQLPLGRIGVSLTKDEKKLHESIIKLRHKVYAHSDEAFAHVRLDIHRMDIDGKQFLVPHMQFNEGLEFADLFKRIAAVELTRKIMDRLFHKVMELGAEMEEAFIYISPSSSEV